MDSFILASKITPPKPRDNFIARKQLEARLSGFLDPFPALIMVVAPTGYGKTSLVSSWLSGNSCCAWLSLGNADEIFISFINYLNAAVKRLFPGFGDFIDSASSSPINRPLEYYAEIFAFEIEKLETGLILVLDNYHEVTDPMTLEFVSMLLDNMPLNLSLVIISQEDPSFSVSRRRLNQQINELRISDLAFNCDEISKALSLHNINSLPVDYLHKIESKTEGWPAAVSLCALALEGLSDNEQLNAIDDSLSSYRYIIDYFTDWMVADIDQDTIEFIRDTVLLDSFTPELADYVRNRTDSADIITKLEKKHIPFFIRKSDRNWYRYHRLFAEYMKSRYKTPQKTAVLKMASIWFDDIEGAAQTSLRYAVRAGDSAWIEELLENKSEELFITGKFEVVKKLLNEIEGRLLYNPSIRRISLWEDFLSGSNAEPIEEGEADADPALRCLRAWQTCRLSPAAAVSDAESSFEELKEKASFFAYMAALIYGRCLSQAARYEKAVEVLSGLERGLRSARFPLIYCLLINYLMKAMRSSGETDRALILAEKALSRETLPEYIAPEEGLILSELAVIHYNSGNGLGAAEYADTALSLLSLIKTENFLPNEDIDFLKRIRAEITKQSMSKASANIEKLSRRENEILSLVEQGYSNREIGERLFISTGTVKWHLNNIFGKLNVNSRMQAILQPKQANP